MQERPICSLSLGPGSTETRPVPSRRPALIAENPVGYPQTPSPTPHLGSGGRPGYPAESAQNAVGNLRVLSVGLQILHLDGAPLLVREPRQGGVPPTFRSSSPFFFAWSPDPHVAQGGNSGEESPGPPPWGSTIHFAADSTSWGSGPVPQKGTSSRRSGLVHKLFQSMAAARSADRAPALLVLAS